MQMISQKIEQLTLNFQKEVSCVKNAVQDLDNCGTNCLQIGNTEKVIAKMCQ